LERAVGYERELGRVGPETVALSARAAAALASAGRRARGRGDMRASANLLGRAVALLDADDEARLSLLPELGVALTESGDLAGADVVLTDAVGRAIARGDRGLEAHARIALLLLEESTDPERLYEQALPVLERVIPTLEELGDDLGLARAFRLMTDVYWARARYGEVDRAVERAIEHARSAGATWEEADSLGQYAGSGLFGPAPVDDVVRRCERILDEASGYRTAVAGALRALGAARAMQGRFDEARELVHRSRTMLDDLGLPLRAAFATEAIGFVETLAGDHEAAEAVLRDGYEEIGRLGERGYQSTVAALLAHALWALGRPDEAERFAAVAGDIGAEDDLSTQVAWRSASAKVLASRGLAQEAAARAREAVDLAERTDDVNMQADAWLDVSVVTALGGEADRAREAAARAEALYERKGNVVSAGRAHALAVR
jgi:hypothetical protein